MQVHDVYRSGSLKIFRFSLFAERKLLFRTPRVKEILLFSMCLLIAESLIFQLHHPVYLYLARARDRRSVLVRDARATPSEVAAI